MWFDRRNVGGINIINTYQRVCLCLQTHACTAFLQTKARACIFVNKSTVRASVCFQTTTCLWCGPGTASSWWLVCHLSITSCMSVRHHRLRFRLKDTIKEVIYILKYSNTEFFHFVWHPSLDMAIVWPWMVIKVWKMYFSFHWAFKAVVLNLYRPRNTPP